LRGIQYVKVGRKHGLRLFHANGRNEGKSKTEKYIKGGKWTDPECGCKSTPAITKLGGKRHRRGKSV